MSQDTTSYPTHDLGDQPVVPPAYQAPSEPQPEQQPGGFRHRVLGLRGVAAVALASLILGGAGGVLLGHLGNGADGTNGGRFGGPGGGGGQFPGGLQFPGQQQGGTQNGPGGQAPQGGFQGGPQGGFQGSGGLPPATQPNQDTQPDSGGTTSGQNS